MTIGSLFSGIGGLELGLEQAGLSPVLWQVEKDEWCRKVLEKHWPDTRRYNDVREVGATQLLPVEILCGGPPCQDNSDANVSSTKAGLAGAQSGLMWELLRIVEELQPQWTVIENVDGAARKLWVPSVRRRLHELGYTSVPFRVRACDIGAPFRGSRIFVVATPYSDSKSTRALHEQVARLPEIAKACWQDWGLPPSSALGVANGVPNFMDQLRAYGNAVMPIMGKVVGTLIKETQ